MCGCWVAAYDPRPVLKQEQQQNGSTGGEEDLRGILPVRRAGPRPCLVPTVPVLLGVVGHAERKLHLLLGAKVMSRGLCFPYLADERGRAERRLVPLREDRWSHGSLYFQSQVMRGRIDPWRVLTCSVSATRGLRVILRFVAGADRREEP